MLHLAFFVCCLLSSFMQPISTGVVHYKMISVLVMHAQFDSECQTKES